MLLCCYWFIIAHYIILLKIRITCHIIECFYILCLVDPVVGVHLLGVVNSPISALSVLPVHYYGPVRPQTTPFVIPIIRVTEFLDYLIHGLVAVKEAPRGQLFRRCEVPATLSHFLARGILVLSNATTSTVLPGPPVVWIDRCAEGLSPG
jgi:hypothetical protein